MSTPTYAQVFEIAMDAERKAGQLYHSFVSLFAAYPPAVELWTNLARDEGYHLRVLEQIRDGLPEETLLEEVDPLLWEQAEILRRLEKSTSTFVVENMDEAYQLTHELEHSEVNTMFEFLVHAFSNGTEMETIALQQLREHLRRLLRAEELLGPAEVRKRIKAAKIDVA